MNKKNLYSEKDIIAIGQLRSQGKTREEAEGILSTSKKIRRFL